MLRSENSIYDIELIALGQKLAYKCRYNAIVKTDELNDFKRSFTIIISTAYEKLVGKDNLKELIAKKQKQIIIEMDFKDNTFFLLLVYQLLAEPTYTIKLILDYHFQSTTKKTHFIDKMEFFVLRLTFQNASFFKVDEIIKHIRGWIQEKRKTYPYNTTSEIVRTNSESFVQFSGDVKDLESFLIRNSKIEIETEDLLNALKCISPIIPVKIKKNTTGFMYFFSNKRLFANKTKKKVIANWLCKYFVRKDKNGNVNPLMFDYCYSVLTKENKKPKAESIIQGFPF